MKWLVLVLLVLCRCAVCLGVNSTLEEDWCISGNGIQICSSRRMAGAVDSVTWNGVQFINAYDHGRELQIAITTHDGECYNPTEAGRSNDGAKATTTSVLEGVSTSGNVLRTTVLPAFWLAPGQCEPGCGCARNKEAVSKYETSKAVQIGYKGVPNALYYMFTVVVPESQSWLQFESPTGYMPIRFGSFYTIDLATGKLQAVDHGPGETPQPVILATSDSAFAMGSFLETYPHADLISYARFYFPSSDPAWATSKWSDVWRSGAGFVAGQRLDFRSVVCLGTLQMVVDCMMKTRP